MTFIKKIIKNKCLFVLMLLFCFLVSFVCVCVCVCVCVFLCFFLWGSMYIYHLMTNSH